MDLDAIPPAPREPSPLAAQLVTGSGPGGKALTIVGLAFVGVGILLATVFAIVGMPTGFLAIPLFFPVLGVILYAGAKVSSKSRAEVFRNGQPAVGKITFAGLDYNTRINGRNPFRLRWEFAVDTGIFMGSLSSMSATTLRDLPQNGEVPVLYDPKNPRRNTLYIA